MFNCDTTHLHTPDYIKSPLNGVSYCVSLADWTTRYVSRPPAALLGGPLEHEA